MFRSYTANALSLPVAPHLFIPQTIRSHQSNRFVYRLVGQPSPEYYTMKPSEILAGHDARIVEIERKIRGIKADLRRERLRILMENDKIRRMYEAAWEQADQILEKDRAGSALLVKLRLWQDNMNQENQTVVVFIVCWKSGRARQLTQKPDETPYGTFTHFRCSIKQTECVLLPKCA